MIDIERDPEGLLVCIAGCAYVHGLACHCLVDCAGSLEKGFRLWSAATSSAQCPHHLWPSPDRGLGSIPVRTLGLLRNPDPSKISPAPLYLCVALTLMRVRGGVSVRTRHRLCPRAMRVP